MLLILQLKSVDNENFMSPLIYDFFYSSNGLLFITSKVAVLFFYLSPSFNLNGTE